MANQTRQNSKNKQTRVSKAPPKKKRAKRSFRSILTKTIIGGIFISCLLFLMGVGLFAYYAKDAPKLTDESLDAPVSSKFFDANNQNFLDIGAEKRIKIGPTEVPQQLADAVISIEDKRFNKHIGIDPIRIVGSAVNNLLRGTKQGGSTLTQQLIKLSYFSTNAKDQTIKRKAQEAWLSIKVEQQKSKQEILTYYINKVYMANGLYGMETASETYYGKKLNELSLPQTALLAGLPNAPSYYDPHVNKEAAKQRRNLVLKAMLDNQKINQTDYQTAINTDISDGLLPLQPADNEWKYYDNYIQQVKEEVKEKTGKNIDTDGLQVYTNLDSEAQKKLYEIVNTNQYVNFPDEKMQVASTLIDVSSGKVVAQIGGRNVPADTRFGTNLAVSTQRDFGSTVKPITDYGPAFEYLHYSSGRIIKDEPYKYKGTDISLNNWDNRFFGNLTLRNALSLSRNIPAAKLFNEVGPEKITSFLKGLGVEYKAITESNAISSNTEQDGNKYGVSSLKMAAAYAAFSNGGTYYKPQYVNKIVYPDGTEETFTPEGKKAMDPGTAYMITDILKGVITTTGANAGIRGLYQAGKTGTSNYTEDQLEKINSREAIYPDFSFVGYTPNYSLAVWTGYNNILDPVTASTSRIATDVYREFMEYVSASVENKDWRMPSNLVRYGNELYFKDNLKDRIVPESVPRTSSTSSSTTSSSSTAEEKSTESSTSSSSTTSSQSPSSESTTSSTQTVPSSTSQSH